MAAVLFRRPVFSEVLRLSKPIKPLVRTLQPSDNHRSDLRLMTKKMENSRGCFMGVKIESSKNVTQCSEQSPRRVFRGAVIRAPTPVGGAPGERFVSSCLSSTAAMHDASAGESRVFLFKGTSSTSSCSEQHQNAPASVIIVCRSWLSRTRQGEAGWRHLTPGQREKGEPRIPDFADME